MVKGESRNLNSQSLALYNSTPYNDFTLTHELLHCLGLFHTFKIDGSYAFLFPNERFVHLKTITESEKDDYIKTHDVISDNLMGYNLDNAQFLWNWQIDIIQRSTNSIK